MTTEWNHAVTDGVPQPSLVADVNAEPDSLLQALVQSVNQFDYQVGVTLHVSGLIVTGTLISHKSFLQSLGGLLRGEAAAETNEVRTGFAAMFEELSGDVARTMASDNPPRDDKYVHLRDAIVFAPGVAPTLPETLWRGRVSHVSAWSIGKIEVGS